MDLVNSVTQNSNNKNVTMENQGIDEDNNDDRSKQFDNSNKLNLEDKQLMASSNEETQATTTTTTMSAGNQRQAPVRSQGVPDYLKAIGMDPKKFWPKKYRFTREKSPGQHNPLTIAQRNFYEANGYIVIDDCGPKRLLDSIRSQHNESSFVSEFLVDKLVAKNQRLLQYAKCFCDDRLMLMTHRLVETFQTNEMAKEIIDNKQLARQQLFRDWIYLPFRPIDKICCAITAVEALEHTILVVPGTHRIGQSIISSTLENISVAYDSSQERSAQLREIFECSPEKLSTLVEKSKRGFKYVNLKAGQTIFYHPGLIHGFTNDLVNFRKKQLASVAYYAAADCEYIDLRRSSELMSPDNDVPPTLAHFGDKNPSDYTSWIDKPILLKDLREANL